MIGSAQAPELPAPTRTGPPRYGLLLICVVASLIVQGAVPPGAVQQVAVTVLGGASFVLALRAARFPDRVLRLALAIACFAVAISVVRAITGGVGEGAARAMNAALLACGPPAVAVGVLRDLRQQGAVRLQAVLGVLALYLLVGMFYGFVYGAFDQLGNGEFFANGAPATVSNCVYYSFTTLATVGYGDLVTRTDVGHTLSISEALLGQLYLVTVVSLVVSNLGQPARGRRNGGG